MRVEQAKILAEPLNTTAAYLLGIDTGSFEENLTEDQLELIAVIERVAQLSDADSRQVTSMLKGYLQHKS